ncbi:response regulator [Chitinophaga sp. 30R24]|uniref:response regulator n=1 Tax=Chitinophaga sp. 30R24 TaxID=3248838 RepID=UPI003B911E7C
MIRLFFVDDHPLILEGLKSLLSLEDNLEIIGESRTGASCLHVLAHHAVDVVLLDTALPDNNGANLCATIKQLYPHIKILALSYSKNDLNISPMLAHGAAGCLIKNADKEELLAAIETVYAGHTFLSSALETVSVKNDKPQPHITKREKEVLSLIANGHTNHEIAEKLFISTDTVDSHRRNLLGKLKARNTAMLIKCAFTNKILTEFSH